MLNYARMKKATQNLKKVPIPIPEGISSLIKV